ncbi:MAG: molybdopterin cofactor-binding domain-containing protein, partial [Chloroflexota bacterium]
MSEKRKWRVTRRGFLTAAGATAGVLALGVVFGRGPFYRSLASSPAEAEPPPGSTPLNTPDAWFEITAQDEVRLMLNKVEMGQGIHTALAQIAAEELDARWEQITIVQASTAYGPGDALGTQASASITASWLPMRQAAATLRETLKLALAEQLNTDVNRFQTSKGGVEHVADSSIRMTYGEIVALTETWPEVTAEPVLKGRDSYRLIGQSKGRVDLLSKVRGDAEYAFDVKVDGMVYGAVAHPPFVGAEMAQVSEGDAGTLPGVIQVVIDRRAGIAGVVAETRTQAWRGVNRLEIEWSQPTAMTTGEILDQLDVSGRGYQMQIVGDASRASGNAPTLDVEYSTPLGVHATMSPQAALADFKNGRVTVWTDSQFPESTRTQVANRLGVAESAVEIQPTYLGGGFGRKLEVESAEEAAFLSRAVGRPVHLGWNRREMMQLGIYRPPTRNRLQATLDGDRINAWETTHASGETIWPTLNPAIQALLGVDFGSYNGTINFYEEIPNRLLTTNIVNLPIRTGLWRGLGLMGNTFATESFMDELAVAAGVDPLQFRLNHLGSSDFNRRIAVVLERVAEASGWGTPLPDGRGRGIATCADTGTCMAMVAEVSIDDLGLNVERVTAAIDAGLIINPDGAIAQVESCIMMGVSAALTETIDVVDGEVSQRNFDTYELLRIDRAPDILVELIDSPLD